MGGTFPVYTAYRMVVHWIAQSHFQVVRISDVNGEKPFMGMFDEDVCPRLLRPSIRLFVLANVKTDSPAV